jgi:Crp-like helix-turn-helix domain
LYASKEQSGRGRPDRSALQLDGEEIGPHFAAARYGGKDQPEAVIPKISQETLAEMIGTTRTRVNLFMNKFSKLGFIEYNGEIKINKSLLTVVLHE